MQVEEETCCMHHVQLLVIAIRCKNVFRCVRCDRVSVSVCHQLAGEMRRVASLSLEGIARGADTNPIQWCGAWANKLQYDDDFKQRQQQRSACIPIGKLHRPQPLIYASTMYM